MAIREMIMTSFGLDHSLVNILEKKYWKIEKKICVTFVGIGWTVLINSLWTRDLGFESRDCQRICKEIILDKIWSNFFVLKPLTGGGWGDRLSRPEAKILRISSRSLPAEISIDNQACDKALQ